jgi:hypothetical protein
MEMQIAGASSNWVLRIEAQAVTASAMVKQGAVHKGTRLFARVTRSKSITATTSKTAVSPDQLSAILPRLPPIIETRLFWMVHCSGEEKSAGVRPPLPLMPPCNHVPFQMRLHSLTH